MNPTAAAMAIIDALVNATSGGWAATDDSALVAALDAPMAPNPAPQDTIPTPFSFADVAGALSQAHLAAILALPAFAQEILPLLQMVPQTAASLTSLMELTATVEADRTISPSEASALTAIWTATELDPSSPSTVPTITLASQLGRLADLGDLAATRAVYAPGTQD